LRDPHTHGGLRNAEVFASGVRRPFGIAFKEDYVYVGNMNESFVFAMKPKTRAARVRKRHRLRLTTGGHGDAIAGVFRRWKPPFVGVRLSPRNMTRARIRGGSGNHCDPDGKNARLYAGIAESRGGLGAEPVTGEYGHRQRTRRAGGTTCRLIIHLDEGRRVLRVAVQLNRRQRGRG